MKRGDIPYKDLGEQLAIIRNRRSESVAEASGAVEIDDARLRQYESGETRPSEDILQLLIIHFDVEPREAEKLWELAGYSGNRVSGSSEDHSLVPQPAIMLLPMDARIVYTDAVNVAVNNYGVVINFLQNSGAPGQPLTVARMGMSIEHAKSVAEVLQQTIAKAVGPKQINLLPAGKKTSKKRKS